jgi:type II secretory pathway component PulF
MGLLQPQVISLVRIGEETGRLSENLKAIALQEQKEEEFRSKVTSALMYPVFVFALTLIIGIGISWFILPRLATVFSSLNITLPLITKLLIGFGAFLGAYGFIVVPGGMVLLAIIFYFLFVYPKTKIVGEYIMLAMPVLKRLILEVEISRFGYIMGTLLQAGLPVVPALKSLANSSSFTFYKRFYSYLHDNIEEGNSFEKSFADFKHMNKVMPTSMQQLIISAERSGHLPETFIKIGEMYESKTEVTTKNLTVLLEPILLVIIWLGVVGVAMAVILPLYSLVGGLNNTTSAPPPPPAPIKTTVTFTPTPIPRNRLRLKTGNEFANVRELPNRNGKVVGQIDEGKTYVYTDQQNGWYKITLDTPVIPTTAASAISITASPAPPQIVDSGWVLGDLVEIIEAGSI